MQRQRSVFNSFPETTGIDQGSASHDTGMSQQISLGNMLNPVENMLSNDAVTSGEASCRNAITHDVQSFSGWNVGESSSRLTAQNQVNADGITIEERLFSSVNDHAVAGPRSEERQFGPTNFLFPGGVSIGNNGNQIRSGPGPVFLQGSSSNHVLPNLNPNAAYVGNSGNDGHNTGAVLSSNRFNSGGLEIEQASSSGVCSDDVGASSGTCGYIVEETNGGSGSLGGWGSSCKRKALEGTSGHSYPGGSSRCFPQVENEAWHTSPPRHNASGGISLPMTLRNSPSIGRPEQLNPRAGYVARGVASDPFASSRVAALHEPIHFVRRVFPEHQQESVTFNLSTTGGARRSNVWSTHQSPRPFPYSDSLDLRSRSASPANSSASQSQPHAMHTPASSRNLHSLPWNGSSNTRAGNVSSSLIPGESSIGLREEVNSRSIPRNSAEHPMFVPAPEMRNVVQDPPSWSLGPGNMNNVDTVPSNRLPPWIANPNSAAQNPPSFAEFASWTLFSSSEPEAGGHSGHFSPLSSGPATSSQETVMSSGSSSQGHNPPFPRSALVRETQGDDVLGMPRSLRALAADIEGRHRLISEIRQVLNAMRRGENLRVEDYMLFDPFIYHGTAEMHDRHRDMRLDVDNMSYEELLALEERIGDVSTGLSEETILKLMKQRRYMSIATESPADLEPCCICQEEYVDGDDLGMVDCGHEFHTNCIKQWLMHKNLCPICKMTALLA